MSNLHELNQLAGQKSFHFSLGNHQTAVQKALVDLRGNDILARIWKHDHTVWKPDPTEITNRLGWLHSPEVMMEAIPEITALVEAMRAEGYTQTLLLGMGGSSLAPEVFRFTFGVKPGYLDLTVLDSTDPGAVLAQTKRLDPAKTLFIVSTKSGGTVETFSLASCHDGWLWPALFAFHRPASQRRCRQRVFYSIHCRSVARC